MKVVCVNNRDMDGAMETFVNLTIGKAYEVIGDSASHTVFNIINDIGNRGSYYYERFISLEESREKKLNKILSE